jgi:alpha-amylase
VIEALGYDGILLEGADHILGWRSPNFLYRPDGGKNIKLLLKNYRLSDDIAFRFSNKGWADYPLTADKFARWVNEINGNGNTVNLFMDYETFGEHQWEDTGIFSFLRELPGEILKHKDNYFCTPSEIVRKYSSVGELDIPHFISWADIERDTSAWTGNDMQKAAMAYIYEIEKEVKKTENEKIISDWRKLQTSDHFYYMCTKWFSDGDVHKYFNPYQSPYEAFINFNNIFNDLLERVEKANKTKISSSLIEEVKLGFIKRGEFDETN